MVPALPPVADIATEVWCIAARVSPEHCAPALGPASHLIIYHYVVEGDLHLRMQGEGENGEEVVIGAGEIVLLPRNDLHIIGSDLTLPPVAGREVIHPPKNGGLFSIHHGGNGKRTRMVCGFLGCAKGEANPVISSLPRVSLPLEGRVPARRSGRAGIETSRRTLTEQECDGAVDDFIALVAAVDGILQMQARADADYFVANCNRTVHVQESDRLTTQFLKAYRWQ